MKAINPIKFVYFDLGGVMFRWRGIYKNIAEKHHKPIDLIEKLYLKYDPLSCRGKITPHQLWQGLKKDLDIKDDKGYDFVRHAMESFTPIHETHEFARQIHHKYPIGLLTNIHIGFYDLSLEHGHIPVLPFRVVVESCALGVIKPDKEIYRHAQKKAGVPNENILFIDDFAENIISARELGWQTVHFETHNPTVSIKEINNILKSNV